MHVWGGNHSNFVVLLIVLVESVYTHWGDFRTCGLDFVEL